MRSPVFLYSYQQKQDFQETYIKNKHCNNSPKKKPIEMGF